MSRRNLHRKWQKREIDWDNVSLASSFAGVPYCERCGCLGNEQCNHESICGSCGLYEDMICPCCKQLEKKMPKKKTKTIAKP